jgi:hypothetical protein
MSFFVMAEQRRYRIRYRGREEFFFAFAKRPARRVFKEQFATRGGGRASFATWSNGRRFSRIAAKFRARRGMSSSRPLSWSV